MKIPHTRRVSWEGDGRMPSRMVESGGIPTRSRDDRRRSSGSSRSPATSSKQSRSMSSASCVKSSHRTGVPQRAPKSRSSAKVSASTSGSPRRPPIACDRRSVSSASHDLSTKEAGGSPGSSIRIPPSAPELAASAALFFILEKPCISWLLC